MFVAYKIMDTKHNFNRDREEIIKQRKGSPPHSSERLRSVSTMLSWRKVMKAQYTQGQHFYDHFNLKNWKSNPKINFLAF